MTDPDPDKLWADLEKIGNSECIQRLHNLYSGTDKPKIRQRILTMLNKLEDNTHFDDVENYFLSDEDSQVRIEAAKLLAFNYDKARAIRPLIWVFENFENEPEEQIRITALRLLVALAYKKEFRNLIIETLNKLLRGHDDKLKQEAIESLGILKEPSANSCLRELLNSPKLSVRARAIKALGEIGNKEMAPDIIKNLGHEGSDIWSISFEALKKMLNGNIFETLVKTLQVAEQKPKDRESASLRRGIIRALGKLNDPKATKILIHSLEDEFYWVRWEAIEALDRINPKWKEEHKELQYKYSLDIKK